MVRAYGSAAAAEQATRAAGTPGAPAPRLVPWTATRGHAPHAPRPRRAALSLPPQARCACSTSVRAALMRASMPCWRTLRRLWCGRWSATW